jgi:hypothetical protein
LIKPTPNPSPGGKAEKIMTNTKITIAQIKAQVKRINDGKNVDADYANLRRLQKAFARSLSKENCIETSPSIIRHLNVRDFPSGTLIRVRKYRINCNKGKSLVWHSETFKDLYVNQMPLYIKDFLGV